MMDDIEFNSIDLDDLVTDTDMNNQPQKTQPASTESNFGSSSVPTENSANNRPRLRKIKRPKQHNGPIGGTSTFPTPSMNNTAPEGLIRSSSRPTNQQVNPYSEPQTNYPVQNYNSSYVDDNYVDEPENYDIAQVVDIKKILGLAIGCLLAGMFLGSFFFSSEQVVQNGLQGVVVNPEVPKGRSRCGIAEKTQGCVLYIMNPQRQELNGRDFYDLASQLTGRQRFVIETGNMRYSSVKIKPGNIAQLNIPPLQ